MCVSARARAGIQSSCPCCAAPRRNVAAVQRSGTGAGRGPLGLGDTAIFDGSAVGIAIHFGRRVARAKVSGKCTAKSSAGSSTRCQWARCRFGGRVSCRADRPLDAAATAWTTRHEACARHRPYVGSSGTLVLSVETEGDPYWPSQWRKGQALRRQSRQGREEGEEEARGTPAERRCVTHYLGCLLFNPIASCAPCRW